MATVEQLFSSSGLDLTVPDASAEFPAQGTDVDEWHARLRSGPPERDLAFFDEQLCFLLVMRLAHPDSDAAPPPDAARPPVQLLALLARVQLALDATYISSAPTGVQGPGGTIRMSAPPRAGSLGRLKTRPPNIHPSGSHPSIFPPATPHPTPSTGDQDRKYVRAEGTVLASTVWGEGAPDEWEAFSLLYSEAEQMWLAVFRMSVGVSFLRMNLSDPLLCLTVSATLREKPLEMTPARQVLAKLIEHAGGLPTVDNSTPQLGSDGDGTPKKNEMTGLDEVNLLEGLSAGPTFSSPEPAFLPSTRLGATTRRQAFSLPATTASSSSALTTPSPAPSTPSARQTLRKSFRKTLRTASGFRVRMRTVFVPYVLLPSAHTPSGAGDDEDADARERREAGDAEHTVVLCVEVENLGESRMGFAVTRIDVRIGGDGAHAVLIGWGPGTDAAAAAKAFPLHIGAHEQHNLLYAVSFLRAPDADEMTLAGRGASGRAGAGTVGDLQRAVAINIFGRPYDTPKDRDGRIGSAGAADDGRLYPSQPFSSRWNCVLDLTPRRSRDSVEFNTDDGGDVGRYALPEPASPFPGVGSPATAGLSAFSFSQMQDKRPGAIAGSKRHTLTAFSPHDRSQARMSSPLSVSTSGIGAGKNAAWWSPTAAPASPVNYRAPTSMLNPAFQREHDAGRRGSGAALGTGPTPPSLALALQQQSLRTPTTYGAPSPLSPPLPALPGAPRRTSYSGSDRGSDDATAYGAVPPTPAYPAYPSSPPAPLPHGARPTAAQQSGAGAVGPAVEIRRERGALGLLAMGGVTPGGAAVGTPQTPGPKVPMGMGMGMGMGGGADRLQSVVSMGTGGPLASSPADGEPVVVSVGMLYQARKKRPARGKGSDATSSGSSGDDAEGEGSASAPASDSDPDSDSDSGTGEGAEPEARGALEYGRLYPLDRFTLDIFVFNQSSWTRRLEVSYPERKRRRQERAAGGRHGAGDAPGIVPLENRIRIGPLRPSTCQSVRMDFMAMTPGVHSVDSLILTDVETGYSVNLKSVMDVVVHDSDSV